MVLATVLAFALVASGRLGTEAESKQPKQIGASLTMEPAFHFKIASFNLLGHSHTARGGRRPGFAAGPTRMRTSLRLLHRHGVDVVGLQEMQYPQWAVINERSDEWGVYPGDLNRRGMANSIAWRHSTFRLISAELTPITYFAGRIRPMPYVLLEHRATGERIWVANFHNPADVHGDASRWRREAVRREIKLARRLTRSGIPVFFTGDMNERESLFCRLTRRTDLRAANGGSNDGTCHPPEPALIDWIFASSRVLLDDYTVDRGKTVTRISDHPIVLARASVPLRRR